MAVYGGVPRASLDDARAVLKRYFGYPDFRPPQIRAVEAVLSGRDALIVLPTGGGKSLCYQVPALVRDGLTVVISPLISLMKDQVDALERRQIRATFLNSTLPADETAARLRRLQQGALTLLYLAPERLENSAMLERLASTGVALLAIDEAHCISEWGHDFRPAFRQLGAVRARLGQPQTVALTATATPEVRADIARQLRLKAPTIVVGGFDRANLSYFVESARSVSEKDLRAVRWLKESDAPAVVYTPTRKAVERVTSVLVRARINAVAYHGGLDDTLRQRAQDAFMRGKSRVIVATSAFGMGIDKPDVRLVVHHAMPGTLEAYYQEAGRAGRDGRASRCLLLYNFSDRFTHEFFLAGAHPGRAVIERTWSALLRLRETGSAVPPSVESLQSVLGRGTEPRLVSAALRVLAGAGVVILDRPSLGAIWVRLLATPERISTELCLDREADRQVLRALWRCAGERLLNGATIEISDLSPSLGGSVGLVPVLKRLEAEQFVQWLRTGGGVRLNTAVSAGSRLPVDWSALERRRRADLSRLDAMQRYAQTRDCRRAFVLRYFGDPETRSHCAACDRCLGLPRAPRFTRIR